MIIRLDKLLKALFHYILQHNAAGYHALYTGEATYYSS
jgi:hypothetical protein